MILGESRSFESGNGDRPVNRLKQLWSILRSSFWFVPSLIVAVSIALAVALIGVDFTGSEQWLARWPRLFGVGADGARGMLSTIAGSMMTVVGCRSSRTLEPHVSRSLRLIAQFLIFSFGKNI